MLRFLFARHERALMGESPEHTQIVRSEISLNEKFPSNSIVSVSKTAGYSCICFALTI